MEASKEDVLRLGEAVIVKLRRLTARPLHIKNLAGTENPGLQAPRAAAEPVLLQGQKVSAKEVVDLKVNIGPSVGDVKSPEDADKKKVGPPSVLTQPIRPCRRRI